MNWKIVSLIAGLMLTASLAACSGNSTEANQVTPSASPTADSMKPDGMKQDGMKPDGMKNDTMKPDTMTKP